MTTKKVKLAVTKFIGNTFTNGLGTFKWDGRFYLYLAKDGHVTIDKEGWVVPEIILLNNQFLFFVHRERKNATHCKYYSITCLLTGMCGFDGRGKPNSIQEAKDGLIEKFSRYSSIPHYTQYLKEYLKEGNVFSPCIAKIG